GLLAWIMDTGILSSTVRSMRSSWVSSRIWWNGLKSLTRPSSLAYCITKTGLGSRAGLLEPAPWLPYRPAGSRNLSKRTAKNKKKEGEKWERSEDTILITAREPEMSG